MAREVWGVRGNLIRATHVLHCSIQENLEHDAAGAGSAERAADTSHIATRAAGHDRSRSLSLAPSRSLHPSLEVMIMCGHHDN